MVEIISGLSLRQALKAARRLGCSVYKPRKTGEVVVRHDDLTTRVRINCRRKDAPKQLVSYLRGLQSRSASRSTAEESSTTDNAAL
jgi:hypothetical protein